MVSCSISIQFEPSSFGRSLHSHSLIEFLFAACSLFEFLVVSGSFGCCYIPVDGGLDVLLLLLLCILQARKVAIGFQSGGFVGREVSFEAFEGLVPED